MNNIFKLKEEIRDGKYNKRFLELYVDEKSLEYQKDRYLNALDSFEKLFGDAEVEIYSAPGRTEVGGNHTDHQRGKVLAASVNLDAIAVVSLNFEDKVVLKSEGYSKIEFDIDDLENRSEEKGTTLSLIKGVIKGFKDQGYRVSGFNTYVTSLVLSGSGISSSAAFEVLIGNILNGLFNEGKVTNVKIAEISKFAENVYFGKPSGLMDQMASSVGGFINIDFKDTENPVIRKLDVDFKEFGHTLCIVDTKGNHADLTHEYAAVTEELKKICSHFKKDVLREVDEDEFYKAVPELRKECGDRAVLRAIHVFNENRRVDDEVAALNSKDFNGFKRQVTESGRSSYELLQNVYPASDPFNQGLSVALALSSKILKDNGAIRVHGGGFAGTIQVFVPDSLTDKYKKEIEEVFGENACYVLKIRPEGGVKVL